MPLFAIGASLVNAALGLGLAYMLGLAEGDAILFMTLAASASYIAVPAAMRMAMPEANPKNCYLMAVCTPEIAERIVEMIRPILKSYGGIALVSDCLSVKH